MARERSSHGLSSVTIARNAILSDLATLRQSTFWQLETGYSWAMMLDKRSATNEGPKRDGVIGTVLVIFGALGIAEAILEKDFRAADANTLRALRQRIPTWLGCLLCVLVGTGLIAIGITILVWRELGDAPK